MRLWFLQPVDPQEGGVLWSAVAGSVSFSFLRGDLDWDGRLTNRDIQPLLDAVIDATAFQSAMHLTKAQFQSVVDINGDEIANDQDIDPFLFFLTGNTISTRAAKECARLEPHCWNGRVNRSLSRPTSGFLVLDPVAGSAAAQVATGNQLLAAVAGDTGIQITQQLGADGLFLVQTASDITYDQLQTVVAQLPGFRYVEPNAIRSLDSIPDDPLFSDLYGLNNTGQSVQGTPRSADADIDAPEAWNISIGINQCGGRHH